MQYESPDYAGLFIIAGEKARPGTFYVPTYSESLSQIANQAYGAGTLPFVLRINKSAWNRANCVYREKSGKCYSKKVSSSLSLSQNSFGDGAWVALCQKDTQSVSSGLGFTYPMIWIPGKDGEEPEDLATDPGTPGVSTPGVGLGEPDPIGMSPTPGVSLVPETPGRGEPEPEPEESGGIPGWVIGVGVGALVLGIAGVAIAKSKKKGD